MAGEWQRMNLRAANVTLIDCDHRTPPAAEEGYPYVAIPQMRGGRIDLADARRISHEHYLEWTRKAKPQTNDVVLSRRCNPGETAVAPPGAEFALGQNLVLLRADGTKVHPPFLRWLVRGPDWWEQIGKFNNVGAVFDSLKCADVPKFELRIPPLPEQRAIAHVLGTLDDKIELNRRMSDTLEAMARALFKSWFVDFDPVRAKAAGRARQDGARSGQPRKPTASGLPWPEAEAGTGAEGDPACWQWPQHILDLFPNRLVDSELGEIPQGWEVGRFGEVVEQLRDQENPLSSPDALFQHFSIPAFDDGQSPKAELGESIKSLKSRVPPEVILLSKLNPEIERVWLVDVRPEDRAVCSTEFLVLRARPQFTRCYAYCLTRSPLFRQQIEGLVTGTSKSHQRAQVESVLNVAAIKPPARVIATFERSAAGMLARSLECRRESRTLAALRDALLPKLISGELRVKAGAKSSEAIA